MCEAASLRTRKLVHQLPRPLTDTNWQAYLLMPKRTCAESDNDSDPRLGG